LGCSLTTMRNINVSIPPEVVLQNNKKLATLVCGKIDSAAIYCCW